VIGDVKFSKTVVCKRVVVCAGIPFFEVLPKIILAVGDDTD
jgi:hypothetical protein